MNKCPHCSQDKCISAFRKLYLGPKYSVKCRFCNKYVSVSYRDTYISTIPIFIAVVLSALRLFNSIQIEILIWVIAFLLSSIINNFWNPLICRDK